MLNRLLKLSIPVLVLCVTAAGSGAFAMPGMKTMLYVANSTGDDVAVIDVANQKLVTRIKLASIVHGVCAPADGRKVYATIESDHTVRVIDTTNNTEIETIPLPGQPNECAITSDGHYLVVPILAPQNLAVIIDTTTKKVVKSLPLRHPHNCFAPEGGSNDVVWCEERDKWRINRIDMKTMEYTDFINVGGDPRPFIITADERTIFTALSGLHGFATVDLVKKTESEVALPPMSLMACRIEPPNTPTHGIERTIDHKKIWITSVADAGVYIYDFATKKLSPKVATGACPNWISMSKDGNYAAVSNADDDDISIFDAHTAKELARIATGNAPKRLLVVDVPQ